MIIESEQFFLIKIIFLNLNFILFIFFFDRIIFQKIHYFRFLIYFHSLSIKK
jgi:hypothetical protein